MAECFSIGIGVNSYDDTNWPNLNNCNTDINNIVSSLINKYGFETPELLFQSNQTTKSAIYTRLYDILTNCTHNDCVFIIFAGHGQYNPVLESTYWIPSDGIANDPSTWLDLAQVTRMMKASPARHICLISDACFSGGIISSPLRGGGNNSFNGKKSRLALTSGSLELVSDGVCGQGSPFANAFVQVLENNKDSEVTFLEICLRCVQEFSTDRAQTPTMGSIEGTGHEGGSFILKLKPLTETISQSRSIFPYRETRIPVKIESNFAFEDTCVIPLFLNTGQNDCTHLNFLIQSMAYENIGIARSYYEEIAENEEMRQQCGIRLFEISYTIHLTTPEVISLSISVYHDFGGPYPYHLINSLTYSLVLQDGLGIEDVVDLACFDSSRSFLILMIHQFGKDHVQKEVLTNLVLKQEDCMPAFYITPDMLVLDFSRDLPHVVRAAGGVEIPRSAINLLI